MERRLAAILAADVVGYSRLMEQDEVGTMAVLADRRRVVFEPLLAKYRGRIVRLMGDGTLAEFASAADAVQCAVDIQKAMKEANANLPDDHAIVLRVGLNLGDVIVEGSDIYGDGVNVAARLEALADPGGICLSGAIHQQVERSLPFAFRDLGDQSLKNIARPVRVYSVVHDKKAGGVSHTVTQTRHAPSKPSIAVLPFANMSGDPEQEYFSDGITEDIITDLSQVSAIFVVARNTVFTFKGKAVEVVAAAQKLNVGYILEGSVRKAGNRIRISVQLIDGKTGGHLWAERYDRDFGDIFSLQDDISKSVVAALSVRLLPEELKTISARSTMNAEAYQWYLQARSTYYLSWGNILELRSARRLFAKAASIDPGYARAYAGIADCDAYLWMHGGLDTSYDQMLANSSKAIELAPNLAEAHASKALALYLTGHADEATSAFERARELDPELFEAYFFNGFSCRDTGQFDKAAALLERAGEILPSDPISLLALSDVYAALGLLAQSQRTARRTIARIEAALDRRPDDAFMISLGAGTLVYIGENARAEEMADRAIALDSENYIVRYNAGCTYAVVGKPDVALECLEHVYSNMPRARRWLLGIASHDTQLNSLRSRSDFQDLMKRLKDDVATHPREP